MKISIAILGAVIGGAAAAAAVVFWLGWGHSGEGQVTHIDPTRSDYVDLLLTLVTIVLAGVGLIVTVGAVVIGVVALKTLREIKDEATKAAKDEAKKAAIDTINATMEEKAQDILSKGDLLDKTMEKMAKEGKLDEIIERVLGNVSEGSLDIGLDGASQESDKEDDPA